MERNHSMTRSRKYWPPRAAARGIAPVTDIRIGRSAVSQRLVDPADPAGILIALDGQLLALAATVLGNIDLFSGNRPAGVQIEKAKAGNRRKVIDREKSIVEREVSPEKGIARHLGDRGSGRPGACRSLIVKPNLRPPDASRGTYTMVIGHHTVSGAHTPCRAQSTTT